MVCIDHGSAPNKVPNHLNLQLFIDTSFWHPIEEDKKRFSYIIIPILSTLNDFNEIRIVYKNQDGSILLTTKATLMM